MTVTPVAAFDFDGTLAKGDSLIPFLIATLPSTRFVRAVASHCLSLGAIAAGLGDRDKIKAAFLRTALKGYPEDVVRKSGEVFANRWIENKLQCSTVDKLRWHLGKGHRVIVVSASLDIYLQPLVARLGVHELACSRLEIENGVVTGELVDGNVRGPHKERKLRELLGDVPVELWAYGDSKGDREMLSMANHPVWVGSNGEMQPWSDHHRSSEH